MEEGKYAEAKDAFTALGDYKDSADKAAECEYQFTTAYVTDALVGEWSSDELDFSKLMTDSILAAVEGNEVTLTVGEDSEVYTYDMENDTLIGDDADLGLTGIVFTKLG